MANRNNIVAPRGVTAITPAYIPNNLEDLLKSIAWTAVNLGDAMRKIDTNIIPSEDKLAGPIHLAALALKLARSKSFGKNVIAVGYLDSLRNGLVAISNLPQNIFPKDYVVICRMSFGIAEACNDPEDIARWKSIISGKGFTVMKIPNDVILERLRKEGKLLK